MLLRWSGALALALQASLAVAQPAKAEQRWTITKNTTANAKQADCWATESRPCAPGKSCQAATPVPYLCPLGSDLAGTNFSKDDRVEMVLRVGGIDCVADRGLRKCEAEKKCEPEPTRKLPCPGVAIEKFLESADPMTTTEVYLSQICACPDKVCVEKLMPEWARSQGDGPRQASTQKKRSAPEQTRYTELLQQLSSCSIRFGAVSSGSGDNTKNTRTEEKHPGAASAEDVGRTLLVAKDAAYVERVLPSDDQLRAWFVCPGSTHPMISAVGSFRQDSARDFARATTTQRVFTSMTEAATRKYASGAAIAFPGNTCRLGAEAIQTRYILAYKAHRQGESDSSLTLTLETWSVEGRVYLAALGITGAGADECIRVVDRVASLVNKDDRSPATRRV